ncbi:glycosyltransferase family 1 protein [Poseidonibacter sp. 1_MG-2023]|uniref:glycosyltransferase family 4 protein n=1 Tax=Poseidonibacter TaxID=2321187 RepID=UPI001E448D0F|nr:MULTISPECIES: glycosyltransferase family 1 protein [Poseidonibacter]MDO6827551.1 glycosyltransferase family 1 protein [Poseidonibacter sp. 1_MG-2023]
MKPKIIIDTISLLSSLTGIGRYTYEIAKRVEKDSGINSSFFYGYHSKTLIESTDKNDLKILKKILSKSQILKKIARKLVTISSRLFVTSYDLYWQPNFIPNEGIKAKKIITTVHDFSFILHKDFHPKERIEHFEKYFLKNIIKSDMIITGSNFSKQEILDRLDFKENQIRVIYHGINHDLFKMYNDIKLDFQVPKKFIFSVGSIEPRKNLLGLLKAYNLLSKDVKSEYKLVLAGFKGWENKEIMQIIDNNKENIIYLGFISDIELAKVYNLATCFLFPSFYEGFGLPVLEAMACGTPVVCSNRSSLPEVGEDAVVYCNPDDISDIKEKIELVLKDTLLQTEMIKKGMQRAKLFSWDKSAKEHIKVFEEVLKN